MESRGLQPPLTTEELDVIEGYVGNDWETKQEYIFYRNAIMNTLLQREGHGISDTHLPAIH
jgi:hypothetical protein